MKKLHPSAPLTQLTDAELVALAEKAWRGWKRGANVLGPRSLHAIRIEQHRRKWNPPAAEMEREPSPRPTPVHPQIGDVQQVEDLGHLRSATW